jgi:hypothetical protein
MLLIPPNNSCQCVSCSLLSAETCQQSPTDALRVLCRVNRLTPPELHAGTSSFHRMSAGTPGPQTSVQAGSPAAGESWQGKRQLRCGSAAAGEGRQGKGGIRCGRGSHPSPACPLRQGRTGPGKCRFRCCRGGVASDAPPLLQGKAGFPCRRGRAALPQRIEAQCTRRCLEQQPDAIYMLSV